MTVSFFALYQTPEDTDAFDANYFGTHVPIVAETPGLLENKVHRVKRQMVGEPPTTCSPSWCSPTRSR